MRIFQAVLYTYLSVLARRISLTIKRFLVCDHFCYSRDLFVGVKGDTLGEKLDASHSWGSFGPS